jgi:formate-dependent phosphoribosylglycinamide formyltransferase (GAR transformylase)
MSHLVFVEITRPGIQALEQAVRRGHTVTRLTSHKFDWLLRPEDHEALGQLGCTTLTIGDSQNADRVEEGLRECLKREPVDAVLSVLHQCVTPAAIAAHRLGLRATSAQGVLNARDKGRCRDLLREHRIPSVRHRVADSADEARAFAAEIGYPVIVKPATGMAKVLASIVEDEAALLRYFEHVAQRRDSLERGVKEELNEHFIVEELAQGPLYSIELAADTRGNWAALTIIKRKTGRRNAVLEMGSTVPSDLDDVRYDQAERYAISVAKVLGLDLGIFHVEFIMTLDGPRLVEVNPRIAGGAIPDLVRTATGVNLFELLVRLYEGEPLPMKRLPCVAAASHTFLTARDDCVVRADLAPDWFEAYRPRLHSGYADIRPGQALRRMDGNYDVYGVVRVTAPSYGQAVVECEELRREIEQTLQIPLVEVKD